MSVERDISLEMPVATVRIKDVVVTPDIRSIRGERPRADHDDAFVAMAAPVPQSHASFARDIICILTDCRIELLQGLFESRQLSSGWARRRWLRLPSEKFRTDRFVWPDVDQEPCQGAHDDNSTWSGRSARRRMSLWETLVV